MFKYENQICPICQKEFREGEDVIVCPECGTPQHRECYKTLGHCVNEDRHAAITEERRRLAAEQAYIEAHEQRDGARQSAVCPRCGSRIDDGANFCPKCGMPTGGADSPFGYAAVRFDPMAGVEPDEDFNGVSAKEAAVCVAVNTNYYMPKFSKFSKGKRFSWNWCAFLFPEIWLLFRKNYVAGVIACVLNVVSNMFSYAALFRLDPYMQGMESWAQMTPEISQSIMNGIVKQGYVPLLFVFASIAITVVYHVVFAIFGNRIYYSEVVSKVKRARDRVERDDVDVELLPNVIRSFGGVNLYLPLICNMILPYISYFVMSGIGS